MSTFYYGHSFPRVFVGTGSIRTSGKTKDLSAGELGFFDKSTLSAIAPEALSTFFSRQFLIAQGSYHTKDSLTAGNLTDTFQRMKDSIKTLGILPKYINQLTKVEPRRATAESWIIGWDGITNCCATLECGSVYTIRLDAQGDSVRRLLNRDWYKEISIETECCDGCESCQGSTVPKLKYFQKAADQINNDPIASKFLRASVMYDLTQNPVTKIPYKKYCLELCDAGDILALASVQSQYASEVITRIERDGKDVVELFDQTQGSISKYQFCSATAPADFEPVAFSLPAKCDVCPTGYTIDLDPAAGPYVKFTVVRPLAGTEDLTTDVSTQAYADAIAGAYGGETPANYLGQNVAGGMVSFVVNKATYDAGVVALLADSIKESGTVSYTCIPADPAPIAWVECGDAFRIDRTLCITLTKECGAATSRVAEVAAFYANRSDVVVGSVALSTQNTPNSNDCAEIIEIKQINNACLEEGCQVRDVAEFDELPSFEGHVWAECPCVEPTDIDTCVGLKIETAFVEPKFGNCSFDPNDHYNLDGIRLSVSLKDDAELCSQTEWPVRKLTSFSQAVGLGESVLRKYLVANGYRLPEETFEIDVRMREVIDQQHLSVVNRSAYYKRLTLNHVIPGAPHGTGMTGLNNGQAYNLDFYFEEGTDTTVFENMLEGFAGQNGVTMEVFK